MKCLLPKDVNTCPFFDDESLGCKNEKRCVYQEAENSQEAASTYKRTERWFEKYYK